MSDKDLIATYYACDDEVFTEIDRRYHKRLEQFFCNGGLTKEDAQDRAQDVFMRVVETKHPTSDRQAKPYDLQAGASFKTWLFTIATNLLIDTLRQQGRTDKFGELDNEEGEEGEVEPFEETLPIEELSPEEVLLVKERRQYVHDCMETLPQSERVVIAL
jgi:RNA polymerase sigma-70 factor (ECF subfamily)